MSRGEVRARQTFLRSHGPLRSTYPILRFMDGKSFPGLGALIPSNGETCLGYQSLWLQTIQLFTSDTLVLSFLCATGNGIALIRKIP